MARTLALLWTGALIVALSIPGDDLPDTALLQYDKLVHVVLFAGLGVLWLRVYPDRARTVVLLGLAFAFLSEVYQLVMPINRSFSLFDALADAVGLAVALGVWWALRRRQAPAPAG